MCETSNFYAEEKLKLYVKSVEGLESTLNEYETSQHYAEEKLKLNQKSMEGLECTVNELESQVTWQSFYFFFVGVLAKNSPFLTM